MDIKYAYRGICLRRASEMTETVDMMNVTREERLRISEEKHNARTSLTSNKFSRVAQYIYYLS